MDMIAQYGVTTEAAKRIMGNCRMLICTMVDNFIDSDCVDTGWREWLRGNDIEVREEDRPSDFLKRLSDEELFQRLVSDGTFYGGMTSAIKACRCMRELGVMTLDEAIEQYHELAKTFDTPEYVEESAAIFQVALWLRELRRLRVERDEYKDIATKLCDKMTDCIYCPYEPDKANERCKLWKIVKGDD